MYRCYSTIPSTIHSSFTHVFRIKIVNIMMTKFLSQLSAVCCKFLFIWCRLVMSDTIKVLYKLISSVVVRKKLKRGKSIYCLCKIWKPHNKYIVWISSLSYPSHTLSFFQSYCCSGCYSFYFFFLLFYSFVGKYSTTGFCYVLLIYVRISSAHRSISYLDFINITKTMK